MNFCKVTEYLVLDPILVYWNNRTTCVALFIYLGVDRSIGAAFEQPSSQLDIQQVLISAHQAVVTYKDYIIMAHFAAAITVISILHPFRQCEGNEWGTMSGGT